MSWAAVAGTVGVASGIGSSLLGSKSAKKFARKQARLAREQADKLRASAAESKLASESEINSLRTLRALDLPAFRQASEQAVIQAQKGGERMQRQRMMGRLAPDVRQAIFGGQFQQYVGRESQRLSQYAGLTERILRATEVQQERALGVEQQATNIELGGQMQALQGEAQAASAKAGILGAVGQAASAFAMSKSAAASKAAETEANFAKDAVLSGMTQEEVRSQAMGYVGMPSGMDTTGMSIPDILKWEQQSLPSPQSLGDFARPGYAGYQAEPLQVPGWPGPDGIEWPAANELRTQPGLIPPRITDLPWTHPRYRPS